MPVILGGNTGIYLASLTPVTPFVNEYSMSFDGVDDSVRIGATPSNLRFNRLDTFSFSAWVKREGTTNKAILSNQLAPSTHYRGYHFAIDSNAKLIVVFRSTLSDSLVFRGNLALDLGWNHVAFTYNGTASTSSGQFYINGNPDTTTGTGTLTGTAESSDVLYLGCRSNADNFFDGKIDELAIFNTELSASDVSTIASTPSDLSAYSGLVSWWRFEGTGTTATDSATGGNDGTLINGVTRTTDVPT